MPDEPEADIALRDEILAVANKVCDEGDRDAIGESCEAHGLDLVVEIPYDDSLLAAERAGQPPFGYRRDGPAVTAIAGLADVLVG